ncbi:MAG: hypothetical protein ACREEZ_10405, partial [Stellaceae bacterium]
MYLLIGAPTNGRALGVRRFEMRCRRYCFAALAGLAFTAAGVVKSEAAPVNYDFSITATSGPLSGTTATGTFSYDTSSIVPGGFNNNTGLLTALDFTWDGITYNQTTANTGYLGFDASGALALDAFGNNCSAGICTVVAGEEQWYFGYPPGFVYAVAGNPGFFSTTEIT